MTRGSRWPCITATTHSRFFIGCMGYQVIVNSDEAQRAAGEVRSAVACMGKRNHAANGGKDCINDPVYGFQIVSPDIFPNLVKIEAGFRMKRVAGHEPGCNLASSYFCRK